MIIDIDKLYITAWFDPSGGRPQNKGNSRASIAVVGMDDLERVYILQTWIAFAGADTMLDRVFRFNDRWKPAVFGVDTTATQTLWLDMFRKESELRNIPMPKLRGIALRGEKRRVIETILQPLAAAGRLFRPPEPEVSELKREWTGFPTLQYRDGLDALAHAIDLLPLRPPAERKALELAHYRKHLEGIGLSQDEVNSRMRQV